MDVLRENMDADSVIIRWRFWLKMVGDSELRLMEVLCLRLMDVQLVKMDGYSGLR